MLDGSTFVGILKDCGVSHVVWIPDTALGTWESALSAAPGLKLIRASREGEAIAIAAGLMLGGKRPIVVMQCTGFFEAGDAFRNVVYDLKLPLFLVIGIRSYYDYQENKTNDSCPVYAEPIIKAWQVPYRLFEKDGKPDDWIAMYKDTFEKGKAGVILAAE